MEREDFLYYLELALRNLDAVKAMRFNIEGEVSRLMKQYTPEEIRKKVGETAFTYHEEQDS